MRRWLTATVLVAALAALAPAAAQAQVSCSSNTVGGFTFTNCYGANGSSYSDTTTQIGSSSFSNGFGNVNGRSITGSGYSTQVGDYSYGSYTFDTPSPTTYTYACYDYRTATYRSCR